METRTSCELRFRKRLESEPDDCPLVRRDSLEEGDIWESRTLCQQDKNVLAESKVRYVRRLMGGHFISSVRDK